MSDWPVEPRFPVTCPHGHHVGWALRNEPTTVTDRRFCAACPQCREEVDVTRSLSIPPEGPVMVSEMEPAKLAKQLLQTSTLSVITARSLGRDRTYVMYIDDWGATKPLPINRRAWALYGGSPVYGLAVLCADDQEPIDDWVIALVSEPDFPPPDVLAQMELFLEEER